MKTAYLGLGSNVGDREDYLARARGLLETPRLLVRRASSLWETAPVDFERQDWFLNQVLEIETDLFPMQLLAKAQEVERALGRVRKIDKGPRTIDVDILLYGRFVIDSPKLTVPHPRLHERRFALAPLAELAPQLQHPRLKQPVSELLSKIQGQAARRR
ncbi:MAG: 2-amino-4-hydroxy-6-hydroxymethyldihydropteridine diphosphokinase [Bryobacteraceae bacterium]|nr:2-amino-4-hydroxy-6-hydroxymethyldihydropteridine diphosphokinase [Bryobacteraceae bacterium]